jgi:hypothetical protein
MVVNVAVEVLGSELVSSVSIGATSLTLLEAGDFSEDGGTVLVGDDSTELVGYSALDDDTGVMLLATPLVAAYAANVRVRKYPLSVEKKADVQIDGEGEAVECVVPISLYDRLDEGVRDDATAEQVLIDKPDDSDTFTIVDILGAEPLVDASFIDPESTIPPPAMSDGLPPSQAPTGVAVEQFAVGALRVTWTAPANPDPMHYRVYARASAGVSTGDEVVADSYGSSAVVSRLGGNPLDYATTYFFAVAAVDADGEGPLSAEASGQPRQAANADLSADEVFAIKVEAAGIQAGIISSDVAVSGSLYVSDFDPDTGLPIDGTVKFLVDGDGSVRGFDSTGVERLTLDPATGSFVFRGDIEADHLTVTNGSIQGGANELAEGATLTLQKGVTTPKNPPSALIDYETLDFGIGGAGLVKSGAFWYTIQSAGSHFEILKIDATTGLVVATSATASGTAGGITTDGTSFFVLNTLADQVWRFNSSLVFQDSSSWPHRDGSRTPVIGYDSAAGEILIAQSRAVDDKVRIRRYTYNAGGTLTNSATGPVDSAFTYLRNLACVLFGSFDLGASRYLFMHSGGPAQIKSVNTSGVEQTADEFDTSATIVGMHWDGTNFYSLDTSSLLRKYEAGAGNRWTTSTDETWYAAYTWYRATGALETLRSPYTTVTMKKRARLTVQTPPLPTGGATPPSEARVYLKKGVTPPGSNPATQNMTRQASTSGSPPTLLVVNATFAANNNPTVSGFGTAGTPATVLAGDGSTISLATDTDQTFTPVLTASTNPTGYTAAGRYRVEAGKWVTLSYDITMPSNANAGAGQYILSLPAGVTLKTPFELFTMGLRDVSAGDSYTVLAMVDTGGAQLRLQALPDTALATGINRVCNANVPVAIGVGDKLVGTFRAQLA